MADVIEFKRLTEEEYDREREKLRQAYGDSRTSAGARFEQELAKLYWRTGWTQDKIAQKEGKSQPTMVRWLRFGRFLNFIHSVNNFENLPNNLTQKRFGTYWERVPDIYAGNERQRFAAVAKLMAEELGLVPPKTKTVTAEIRAFADGRWHLFSEILSSMPEKIGEADVKKAITALRQKAHVESRHEGKEIAYRIFLKETAVSIDELEEKLRPIIKGLREQSKLSQVTISPGTVGSLVSRLINLLKEWRGQQETK